MNTTASTYGNLTITTDLMLVEKTNNMAELLRVAKIMHWYSSVVFGIAFVVVGLIGNILSLIIWSRRSLRSSSGTYLIAQAAADASLLVAFFLTDSLPEMDPDIKKSYSYGVFYSYVGYPIFFFAVIMSIWILVGVTVDRYIQVCWISQSKSMCNQKRARHGIRIITLLCFLINTPHFFTYQPISNQNQTGDAYDLTEFGHGTGSQNYEFWVHCMLLVLIPWVTILSMNVLIIRSVLKSGAKMSGRKSVYANEKTKKAENQLTTILLTVTFTFLVLIALQCITQCFFMLKPEYVNLDLVDEAYSVAKLGVVINSSINFFLYCFSGRRFRKELLAIMGCRFALGDTSEMSSSEQPTSAVKYKDSI